MKQGRFLRILSVVLALIIIWQVGPFTAMAAMSSDFSETGLSSTAPNADQEITSTADECNTPSDIPPTVIGEEEGLRTEEGKHFRLSDGSYVSVSYGMPVHYTDDNGAWQDIDNTLRLDSNRQGETTYTAINGDSAVAFAENLSTGQLFTSAYGQQSVSMFLMDSTVRAQAEGQAETIPITTGDFVQDDTVTEPTEEIVEETITAAEEATETLECTESVQPTVTDEGESIPEDTADEDTEPTSAATESDVQESTEAKETVTIETEATAPTEISVTEPPVGKETEPNGSVPAVIQPNEKTETFNRQAEAQVMTGVTMSIPGEKTDRQEMMDAVYPDTLSSTVLYENVFRGVDLLYNVNGYNIKESIIVKEPLDQYRFSFRLDVNGLTPELQADGSVTMTNQEGTVVYLIPAPYLFDQANHASDAAKYELMESENGYILIVEADADWMNDPERSYPITIDPTLLLLAGNAKDDIYATYVEEGHPNDDHGHYQDLYFGYTNYNGAGERQIYMHFNKLPELPLGSVVVHSSLNLWQFDYSHVGYEQMDIGLYEVTGSKPARYSNYHDWLYYMDWNTKPSFDTANMIDYATASKAVDNSYLSWDLTELTNKWYEEETENRTVALAALENQPFGAKHRAVPVFYAYGSNHPPVLTISYRNNTGIEPYYTYQTMGAGNAGTAYISDYSNQLTVAKELFSFSSTVNPFPVQLVFNSSYFSKRSDTQYDLGKDLDMEMHLGSGCTYNFIQHVKKETIGGIECIRFLDGDGTIHYFSPDKKKDAEIQKETGSSKLIPYYYDEDGLGLKINEYFTEYYSMTDDQGNERVFVNGLLVWFKDETGNKIQIHYSKNGQPIAHDYPTGTGNRIEKITQSNVGGAETTIATFSYKNHTPSNKTVPNYVDTITDYAGNQYSFDYKHGKLVAINYNGRPIAKYTMRSSAGWLQNEMISMEDVEAGYSLNFTYKNRRVAAVEESTADGVGNRVEIQKVDDRRTEYRDIGEDRISGTNDDILTYLGFDYAGRTVDAYTTNSAGNILGASNAVYSGNGTTDRTNNRTMRTASIGVAAQQEIRNYGFESSNSNVAWKIDRLGSESTQIVNGAIRTDKPRTGNQSFKTWITPGNKGVVSASKKTDILQANTCYIASVYVNTSVAREFNGQGMYLKVTDDAGNTWQSRCTNYKTSSLVDDGWVRIAFTFKAKTKCNHTVSICNDGICGVAFADDVQIERAKAPVDPSDLDSTQAVSNVNLLENGNLQYWDYGWIMSSDSCQYVTGIGVNSTSPYAYSIRIRGNSAKNNTASQTVPVNQPGSQTYVLSGWAKANAVPDNKMDRDPETDKEAAAKDQNKQFGLRAVLTYAGNGGTEYHYVPFNPELNDWQFASLTIVPKKEDQTVATIKVECAYEKNANTAWFDDLSLVKESAQSMRYDEKGNLVSVKTSGLKEDANTYKNGNLIKSVTGGNGTYTYTYDKKYKHRLTSVTNDLVTQNIGYDTSGNVSSTTLKSNDSTFTKSLRTTASYTANNNLLASVTDSTNQKITYTYDNKQSIMTGQATTTKDALGHVTTSAYDDLGRTKEKKFANGGKVSYTYEQGLLTDTIRTDALGNTQTMSMGYDSFGNSTDIRIGDILLASYQYAPKNGNLLKQIYGNDDFVSFEYDHLNRVMKSVSSSGRILTYTYTGDGQVYSITDNGATADTSADDTTYYYTYDTMGRIISCQMCQGAEVLLQTHLEYDDYNRIKTQSWQMGTESYKETFQYSQKDGSLQSITTAGGGNSIRLTYDPLQRLSQCDNGLFKRTYAYRDISGAQTTSQVKELGYSNLSGDLSKLAFRYKYDEMGRIASNKKTGDFDEDAYYYDELGQLTEAMIQYGGAHLGYSYSYDGAGNLQRVHAQSDFIETFGYTNTYTYGNSSWHDLLTGFNRQPIWYEGQSLNPDGTVSGTPKSGNPIGYYNGTRWNFQWSEGRNLSKATSSEDNISLSFVYDAHGLRTKKTVSAQNTHEEHSYIYASGKLLRETITDNNVAKTLDFRYDNFGFPYALLYNNGSSTATYYYITNLQGDVMYLVDSKGNQVAEYIYDPYGKVLSSSGTMAEINPLRYRGYYQDDESELYYLQSRYYDPATCRFINSDTYTSTGIGILGNNMFAYCNNNPVINRDSTGAVLETIFDVISLGFSIAEVAANPYDPSAWIGLVGDTVDLIPFVSGVGETVRGLRFLDKAGNAVEIAQRTDNAIDTYNVLRKANKGNGLEVHHILEKRFKSGIDNKKTGNYLSIALPHNQHVEFTNRWRRQIPYGKSNRTKFELFEAANHVYYDHPELMGAVVETLFKN